MTPQFDRILVETIDVGVRLRPLNGEAVERLVESINLIGLQTPISVRYCDEENPDYSYVLVAGAHRLEAVKRLGLDFIDVVIFNEDETGARMWEIAENLHRAELTVLERSEHVAEWVALVDEREEAAALEAMLYGTRQSTDDHFEAANIQPAQVAPVNKGGRSDGGKPKEGGLNAAARELGIERTDAQRSIKIAGLTPEAKQAAVETGRADNQSALLQAAKAPPDQQAEAIRNYTPGGRPAVPEEVLEKFATKAVNRFLADEQREAERLARPPPVPRDTSPNDPNVRIWIEWVSAIKHLFENDPDLPAIAQAVPALGHSVLREAHIAKARLDAWIMELEKLYELETA